MSRCQGPRSEPVSRGRVSGPQERARVQWLGVRAPGASPCPMAECQDPRSEPVSRGRVSGPQERARVPWPGVCCEPSCCTC